MRAKEMRERTDEELMKALEEAKDGLFRQKLKNATHQLDKPHVIGVGRREIARINTILNEKKNSLTTKSSEE